MLPECDREIIMAADNIYTHTHLHMMSIHYIDIMWRFPRNGQAADWTKTEAEETDKQNATYKPHIFLKKKEKEYCALVAKTRSLQPAVPSAARSIFVFSFNGRQILSV